MPIARGSGKSLRVHDGEWITRATIWTALTLYVAGEVAQAAGRGGKDAVVARILSSLGLAAFAAHVACAFHFYHHWSHAEAYQETARQTENLVGRRWGGGIFFNYAFLAAWLGNVVFLWTGKHLPKPVATWASWCLRGFFLLMIVNGAFVFARGPVKWLGLLLSLTLVLCWWPRRDRRV